MFLALSGAALANPPAKKPLFPPPEQSSSVGVLGGPHPGSAPAKRLSSEPPPPAAAPEVYKVEADPPTALPAAPRDVVQGEQPSVAGGTALSMPLAQTPPSGFLPDHPMLSGLVAGLIGSDLGSKLYGGAMSGDRGAAAIGFAVRIALILTLALLLFRFIGRRASAGDDRLVVPKTRRDPSFGKGEPLANGRREPHFERNR